MEKQGPNPIMGIGAFIVVILWIAAFVMGVIAISKAIGVCGS